MTDNRIPRVGDIVEHDGAYHHVVSVTPRLTHYRKKDQFTTMEGWTLTTKQFQPRPSSKVLEWAHRLRGSYP